MDDLIKYRLDSAKDKLYSAKLLLEAGQYNRASELIETIEKYIMNNQ